MEGPAAASRLKPLLQGLCGCVAFDTDACTVTRGITQLVDQRIDAIDGQPQVHMAAARVESFVELLGVMCRQRGVHGTGVLERVGDMDLAHRDQRLACSGPQALGRCTAVGPHQSAGTELDTADQRVTTTATRSSPWPSMAARIGRPAVPPGSPSSLKRYSDPMR